MEGESSGTQPLEPKGSCKPCDPLSLSCLESPFGEAADYDDEKLKELMFAAKNGAAIRDLWNGGNPKGTPSEGDFALMSHLAYWCDGDGPRMISMFLQSARAERPKGQRQDYLNAMARKLAGGGA